MNPMATVEHTRFENTGMDFHQLESLHIASEAHCDLHKWSCHSLSRYWKEKKLSSALSLFTVLYLMVWTDCTFEMETPENNELIVRNGDNVDPEGERKRSTSPSPSPRNMLCIQRSIKDAPKSTATAGFSRAANSTRTQMSPILMCFSMIPSLNTAGLVEMCRITYSARLIWLQHYCSKKNY